MMEEQEQVEWDNVNRLLQHHGFKSVHFTDPVENKNLSDLVLLDKKTACEIRSTLKTMLSDSDRRQALIQEFIKSNNQLKEDVGHQTFRASELELLLDEVQTRVQDLEERCLGTGREGTQKVYQALEQKLSQQKKESSQLQKKLYFTIREEEKRAARQSRTFQQICNRLIQHNSPADQQVLDVIDFYENKTSQLLDELRSLKGEADGSEAHLTRINKSSSNATPSFKTILKAYQEQQEGSNSHIDGLTREVERLKKELETRPTLKEVKIYKHKLRRLEALHQHNNSRLPKEDNSTEISEAGLCVRYQHLLKEISALVSDPKAPVQLHRQKPSRGGSERTEFLTLIPTLEAWAQQLALLKHLQRCLNALGARLMPWQPPDSCHGAAEEVKVEDMMLQVDTMLENTSPDDERVLRSPTRFTLGSIVSHFQKLFDVRSLSGVFPRMNEVYTRLGEMNNTMTNLRDVLDLDSRVSPAEVVNHVDRLVSSSEQTAQLQELLGDADIDSIIVKVKQHEEFFPAFHALTVDILDTLGVSHLGDIVPALKYLKPSEEH